MEQSKTPVLLIAYSKYEICQKVFDAISLYKPTKFFFYVNAVDSNDLKVINNNKLIRELEKKINWTCKYEKFFRSQPVDIYTSLRSAIDWFFSNVNNGVILEEDAIPNIDFFKYVDHYKNIDFKNFDLIISGNNYFPNITNVDSFTKELQIYGWHTTKNVWQDVYNLKWDVKDYILKCILRYNPLLTMYFLVLFINGKKHNDLFLALDLQLQYNIIMTKKKCLRPMNNLCTNAGVNGYHQNREQYYHNVNLGEWKLLSKKMPANNNILDVISIVARIINSFLNKFNKLF